MRIKIEQGRAGLFYATSPDLRGLLVAAADEESLVEAIPVEITNLYAAKGTAPNSEDIIEILP